MKSNDKRKYRKKVFAFFLAVVVFAAGIPLTPEAKAEGVADKAESTESVSNSLAESAQDDFEYQVRENGVMLLGYNGNAETLVIPSQIEDKDVISIANGTFEGCTTLVDVTIPEGVAVIGSDAFDGCTNLVTLRIPSTVEEFDLYYSRCNSLANIIVAEENPNYMSLDGVLFSKDGTTLLKCPKGKTGKYTVPSTVTKIDFQAFDSSALTELVISEGVKTIGNYAFWGSSIEKFTVADNNKSYTAVDGVLFNKAKSKLILCPSNKEGKFIVPNTVTNIGSYAFSGCTKITEVSLPPSVSTISDGAFMSCGLTSIVIPTKVTSIGDSAFSGCSNLETVTFDSNIKTIKSYAFNRCQSLTQVTLPSNLQTIKSTSFYYCSNLERIDIAEENAQYKSVDGVLYNKELTKLIICPCGKSGTLNLPEGLTGLTPESEGMLAYEILDGCEKLTGITFPSTYAGFSDRIYRFTGCTGLEEMNISPEHEKFCSVDGVIYDKDMKSVIFCPVGRKKEYTMPDTVENIYSYAFNGCKSLTKVTISPGVEEINSYSFYYCEIDTVVVPEGVTKLGTWAFEGSFIKKLYLPKSITKINESSYGYKWDGREMQMVALEVQPVVYCQKQSTAYQDALEKGFEIELVRQPSDIVLQNYKPDKVYDGQALTNPSPEQMELTAAAYEEITFTWYQDSVSEENKLSAPPINAGRYILTASVEENDDRMSCIAESDPVQIKKAPQPDTVPESSIQTAYANQKVKDVILPDNWAWKVSDGEKSLEIGNIVRATAEYVGADKGNYEREAVEVEITRVGNASSGTPAPTSTPAPTQTPDVSKQTPKKGEAVTDTKTKAVYTVTNINEKNAAVTYTKSTEKNVKSAAIPATVTIQGQDYKVTAIARDAFKNNKKLTGAVIGKNVTSIGDRAFYGCTALKKITIPSKVSKIGKKAFYGCKKLKNVNIKTGKLTSKSVGSQAFKKIHGKAVVKVPKNKRKAYKKLLKARGITGKRKIK